MSRLLLGLGAISGLISVVLGAFGAHALKARLSPEMLGIFETGVRYQMYHSIALLLVGVLTASRQSAMLNASGIAFSAGIAVFSGSLYVLVLTEVRWLGAITPIGGLALILGWGLLAAGALSA